MAPTSHNMYVPYVTRVEYNLLDIDKDGYLTLMKEGGETKEDLKVDEIEVFVIILVAQGFVSFL